MKTMKNTKNSSYISNSSYKTQISSNENCSISFHGKNDNELGKL